MGVGKDEQAAESRLVVVRVDPDRCRGVCVSGRAAGSGSRTRMRVLEPHVSRDRASLRHCRIDFPKRELKR